MPLWPIEYPGRNAVENNTVLNLIQYLIKPLLFSCFEFCSYIFYTSISDFLSSWKDVTWFSDQRGFYQCTIFLTNITSFLLHTLASYQLSNFEFQYLLFCQSRPVPWISGIAIANILPTVGCPGFQGIHQRLVNLWLDSLSTSPPRSARASLGSPTGCLNAVSILCLLHDGLASSLVTGYACWPPPRRDLPRCTYSHHVADRHLPRWRSLGGLLQRPASRYSRGTCRSTLGKQSGRDEATQTLLFSPLGRDEGKQTVAEWVVCSAWVFACDLLIGNLQGEQGWWGARWPVLPTNLKARTQDTTCWVAWVRGDPSCGGKERDEVLNECVSETDSLTVEISQDKVVCHDTVVSEALVKTFFFFNIITL